MNQNSHAKPKNILICLSTKIVPLYALRNYFE